MKVHLLDVEQQPADGVMAQPADRTADTAPWLPVRVSQLPTADELLPYLRRIDANRWYSNFGLLLREFEGKLANHFEVSPENLVCVANGTAGLIGALHAVDARPGGLCIMPSWTFAATPAAAIAAGLKPYFLDVDPDTWSFGPDRVEAVLADLSEPVAAVMVVSPFGAPIDPDAWDDFWDRTGIPVVIDAAWGFDRSRVGRAPVMVSLHASKSFGVGEGGLVASRLTEVVRRIHHWSNFGFDTRRVAAEAGTNGKMSEHTAAVGLAMFDLWPSQRTQMANVIRQYVAAFDGVPAVRLMPGFGDGWVGGACCVQFDRPFGDNVIEHLRRNGIEGRRWWSQPCHMHPAFATCPAGPLDTTRTLFDTVLAVPLFSGMTSADVLRVRDAVAYAATFN